MNQSDSIKQSYNEGYKTGYTWLTRGWNFLHPNSSYTYADGHKIYGYIPAGPTIHMAHPSDTEEKKHHANLSYKVNHAWVSGWIDGINKYVEDNNLDYPKVEKN